MLDVHWMLSCCSDQDDPVINLCGCLCEHDIRSTDG